MDTTPVAKTPSAVIETKYWICELHSVPCRLSSPCYECRRELTNPEIIESEKRGPADAKTREKNAQPRLRL